MAASPKPGEQTPHHLPTQLPSVLHYHPGKEAVPSNAEVLRPHPPLYAGDFNKRKDAYYWENLNRKNREDERLRLALHYGEERAPRCDLCEKEDRACVSMLGKRFKTTGCARCIRRHFNCSQANGARKSTNNVQKDTDHSFRPSHSRKRATDEMGDREATEPPAKRTRSSMNGRTFELLELSPFVDVDDDDEYHTPMVSRRGSLCTLPASLPSSEDSYRDPPDHRQAEVDHMKRDEQQPDTGDAVDFAYPASSMTWGEQLYPLTHSVPDDRNQTNDPSTETQQNSTTVASSGLGDLSRYFPNHEKVVLDLQSANATLTERVGELESSHNSWQDMQSRIAALESVSAAQQQRQGIQPGLPVTMKALEPRILKLEDAIAGLEDTSVGQHIRRLERMMENEKRERRARVDTLSKQTKSLANDVAVLMSENEGLRERLNKLTGQVRDLRG
ncbi:hypothetical protein E4T44_05696 [Aureobasidium sp. EXF-8845]|nr:hypothetical protein E4T44_05696 [Aureobasidium sp. EXF-8845]KAI4850060.1 hypothetical protein E4T45_05662 [Aureobasidium sp. EXF-8846]